MKRPVTIIVCYSLAILSAVCGFGSRVRATRQDKPKYGDNISGQARLEYHEGFLFVVGKVTGGRSNYYLMDCGSGSTIIAKACLPETITVTPLSDSSDIAGGGVDPILGFAGTIPGYLGYANVPDLLFGSLKFHDVPIKVVADLPDVGGKPICGIIGMDVLACAAVVSFSYPGRFHKSARLVFSSRDEIDYPNAVEIPFTIVNNHIIISGNVNDIPVEFILDIGSPGNIIMPAPAAAAGLAIDTTFRVEFSGLDGIQISGRLGMVDRLGLGKAVFRDISFCVAEMPTLGAPGTKKNIGIIGNEFLSRFHSVVLDYEREVVLLITGKQ
ncbi:MAG: aspartyl protease family protein [Candidatus Zixiibacteriota bacterium]|nr:MAG: aspartyl protease family protein [candidate division Zixibacteria bacterium]